MSEVEQSVIVGSREVVLMTVGPHSNVAKRRAHAKRVQEATGAFVVLVDEGDISSIERLSPAQMREYGWVRVEELHEALAAGT